MAGLARSPLPARAALEQAFRERDHRARRAYSQAMILVTAATGNVGRELVPQLLNAGQQVRAGTRHPQGASFPPGAHATHFDFGDEASVRAAATGAQSVYLIVPETVDTETLTRALSVMKEVGVERVVLQSGFGAGQGDNPLGEAEDSVRASGLNWTILRPNWFMQNYNQMFRRGIRDRHEFAEPAGEQRTSFIDTRDVAAAAVAVLTQPGHDHREYDLTGPHSTDRHAVAAALSSALGHPITYRPVDDDGFVDFLVSTGESDEEEARAIASIYPPIRAGDTAPITPDLHALTGSTGHTLEDFAQHYRQDWLMADG
ncbi:NAD(P)H-binding protein [Deinococcus sp. 14RED07]|uniref:NAD(P)H-binding protein n=1 Tax=Deinococcus sp. 14RED07 TaxID=2745874 RepID=UPI001E3835E1|nr:NAD(P)H-binding protein [Deinococcus sp. 14RED07]MCD0174884.1 NAD(P)H-binding protein [Deinococcus sp. 14RED07]